MVTVYGISNCDTVKKARAWLNERGAEHAFHDFKKQGVTAAALERWLAALGHDKLVNRKGTTWRGLDDASRAAVVDNASAQRVLLQHTSAIKRPVVEWTDGSVTVGFDPADWTRRV